MGLMGLGAAGAVIVASVGAFAVLQIALMVAQGKASAHPTGCSGIGCP